MTKKMPAALAHILAAFTALSWGSSFIASKILLQHYSPTQVMLMRFVLAYAALWLCCPKTLAQLQGGAPFYWPCRQRLQSLLPLRKLRSYLYICRQCKHHRGRSAYSYRPCRPYFSPR